MIPTGLQKVELVLDLIVGGAITGVLIVLFCM